VLVQASSSVSSEPNVRRWTRRNSPGHQCRDCSSLWVDMLTETPRSFSTMDSSRHIFVRTNPCAGAWGSFTLARNQGKQIGIPPRMAWPSCQHDFVLAKSNSSWPTGFQDVTWAPCRYISHSPREPPIWTRGSPPLPSHTLATQGIPEGAWRGNCP